MEKVLEQIKRGVAELFTETDLKKKLARGKPLRIKVGFDPTVADLHLGHTVLMQKMRQFQDLGHHAVFLIGDFTAQIGDPTGRSEARPVLTKKQVHDYAKTYLDQAFKILDKKKTEVRWNSEWLEKLTPMDFINLGSKQTVARMMERQDFKERLATGANLSIYEFYYPLLQAYDSVALQADIELGGMDQKFNILLGRQVQERSDQEPQVALLMPLLIGTDGQKKMSKSYGNYIGVTESPKEMFGKIMSLTDEMMWHYYELLTDGDVAVLKKMHPKEAKVGLARILVERFHSKKEADSSAGEFEKIFSNKEKPTEIEEKEISLKNEIILFSGKEVSLINVMVILHLAGSKTAARNLIVGGGVTIDDVRVTDINVKLNIDKPHLLKIGKRHFLRVRFRS